VATTVYRLFLDVIENRLELLQLRNDHCLAVAFLGIQIEVVLVIFFRGIEFGQWADLRDNLAIVDIAIEFFFVLFGRAALLVVFVEDDGTVLCSFVIPLAIQRGGVVGFPMDLEQFRKRNDIGVVGDLDHFRMPGLARADLFIGRILDVSSGVARDDRLDSLDPLKHGLGAPETTAAKSCTRQSLILLLLGGLRLLGGLGCLGRREWGGSDDPACQEQDRPRTETTKGERVVHVQFFQNGAGNSIRRIVGSSGISYHARSRVLKTGASRGAGANFEER
jgi:hypothetical protein